MDDRELLQEYRERQSEKAFAELVSRHVRLVYATALRLTGERQAAEDVVQVVFLLLARKSWMVRDGNALPGWLYRATQRTAFNEKRKEQRRRQRETEAMTNAELDVKTQAMLAKLLPLLDEALGKLSPVEQNLIILRFFENRSLRETGATAGLSEQATHNRITRAVEKLRQYFARSGVTVASVTVETALTAPSGQAVPVGLAANVTGTALAGSSAALGVGDVILKFFFTMNTKTQVTLAVVVIALMALPFLRSASLPDNRTLVAANDTVAQVAPPPSALQTAAAQSPAVAQPAQSPASEPAAASNPTTPAVAQGGQPRQVAAPTQPRVALPNTSATDVSSGSAQNALRPGPYALQHPLSHNMAVRITGTLGPNKSVDVTMVSNSGSSGTLLYEPQNGVYTGDLPVAGIFNTTVGQADDGYLVVVSVEFMQRVERSTAISSASNNAILQPGGSMALISKDGLVNLTATLMDAPATNSMVNAKDNNEQNLLLRLWGTVDADPIDINWVVARPSPDSHPTQADEQHQLGINVLDGGEIRPIGGHTGFSIFPTNPNAHAEPGTYTVSYMMQFGRPGTTTNAAGKIVPLSNSSDSRFGTVLLKVGQTVTVQDIAGEGSIQISLTTSDY